MLPAYVRDPERAAIWITSWLDRLGATAVAPESPVTVQAEVSGNVAGIWVSADVGFADGRSLHIAVLLDAWLQTRRYTFDLVLNGEREWGWHGHQERAGFHHRHMPPNFEALSAEPATFEKVEELLHRKSGNSPATE